MSHLQRAALSSRGLLRAGQVAGPSRVAFRNLSVSSKGLIPNGRRQLLGQGSAQQIRHLSWSIFQSKPTNPSTSPEPAASSASNASQVAESSSQTSIDATSSPLPSESAATTSANVTDPIHSADATSAATPEISYEPGQSLGDLVLQNPDIPLDGLMRSAEALAAPFSKLDLPALGLTHGWFSPSGWMIDLLAKLHDLTGLPWWASIVLVTCVIRVGVMPLVIRGTKNNVRMAAINPQLRGYQERITNAQKTGDKQALQAAQMGMLQLFAKNDCHPLRSMQLPLLQIPIFFAMFYGLKKLADLPFPPLMQGGFGWVPDLTMADPLWILPATSMILTNIVIRVGADGTGGVQNRGSGSEFTRHLKNIVVVASFVGFFWMKSFPAGVCLYWTTSNAVSLLQAWILKQPAAKKFFDIQSPPPMAAPRGLVEKGEPTFKETFQWAVTDNAAKVFDRYEAIKESRKMKVQDAATLEQQQDSRPSARIEEIYETPLETISEPGSSSSSSTVPSPARTTASSPRSSTIKAQRQPASRLPPKPKRSSAN